METRQGLSMPKPALDALLHANDGVPGGLQLARHATDQAVDEIRPKLCKGGGQPFEPVQGGSKSHLDARPDQT